MRTIKIIIDEAVPTVYLLNSQDFDIFTTQGKDDVFAMSRKIKENENNNGNK